MPSSVIRFYRYDSDKHELLVGFQAGTTYVYSGVPAGVVAALDAAFSKGEFFNSHIRDKYPFRRQ